MSETNQHRLKHGASPLATLGIDDIYPRCLEERYRIYACIGDERSLLATAPDAGGVGQALITLHDDQRSIGRRLADYGRIGVLDTMPDGLPHATGEWVVLPYDRDAAPR